MQVIPKQTTSCLHKTIKKEPSRKLTVFQILHFEMYRADGDVLAKEGSIAKTLFQDQTGLTTINTCDIHTRATTRLLTEWRKDGVAALLLFNIQ
jgi:hypothetical protein